MEGSFFEIIALILGSSAITAVVNGFVNKRKTNAGIYEDYTERLEGRIGKLEHRIDEMEKRDHIFSSAVSCAYRCKLPQDIAQCPVLDYISMHDMPDLPHDTGMTGVRTSAATVKALTDIDRYEGEGI